MKIGFAFVSVSALLGAVLVAPAPALAADVLTITSAVPFSGTVDIKYVDGRVETSEPLWTGQVPTGIRIPIPTNTYSSPCVEVTFPIQAAKDGDRMKDVDVDFEVWTASGVKVMSDGVSGYSGWNPSGGPTQVSMSTCSPMPDGTYNLFVTTQDELSTNGLISRYLEGKQTLPFQVTNTSYVKCKKGYTTKIVKGKKCKSGWTKVRA